MVSRYCRKYPVGNRGSQAPERMENYTGAAPDYHRLQQHHDAHPWPHADGTRQYSSSRLRRTHGDDSIVSECSLLQIVPSLAVNSCLGPPRELSMASSNLSSETRKASDQLSSSKTVTNSEGTLSLHKRVRSSVTIRRYTYGTGNTCTKVWSWVVATLSSRQTTNPLIPSDRLKVTVDRERKVA